jgi:dGTP triphosphohydrolase
MEKFNGQNNAENKETSPEDVFEKTEQSIRILSTLWDKRFDVLGQYYGERNKKRFNVFKSDTVIESEISDILLKITPINNREEKVVDILERGAVSGQEVLQKSLQQPENISASEAEAVSEFNEKVSSFSNIIQRYTELVSQHKDILEIEKELIDSPDEQKFQLYLKRMEMFSAEFKALEEGKIEELKKYFSDIENDLKKVQEALKQGKPLEYLKQSLVSAVVRVVVSNIAAGFLVGDPLKNPYFWQLMAATVPAVLAVNYVDYYFKVFTKITQKINNLIK